MTMNKRLYTIYGCLLSVALMSFGILAGDLKPQPYYSKIAQRLAKMLPAYHVLASPMDEEISKKAWTNLINQYDYNHSIFLQSDLDRFEAMQTNLADAIDNGQVDFGYEVYRVFAIRLQDRMNFVTNLLMRADFDFGGTNEISRANSNAVSGVQISFDKEDGEGYLWNRKEAAWPKTRVEQNEIWYKRIKNELLAQVLARELDEEEAIAKYKTKQKHQTSEVTNEVAEATSENNNDDDDYEEKARTPRENLIKRYRQYASILADDDEEVVLQRYLSAVAQAYDPHTDYMSPTRKEDFDMDMNLSLCGVGAVLMMDDGALKISKVMPGGPMARDGRIKKGDKIVGVGQGDLKSAVIEDILYKPMKKSIRKIRGRKGSKVTLEVIPRSDPSGVKHKRITLVRDEIRLEEQAATGRVEQVVLNGVTNYFGYVALPSFYGTMEKRPNEPDYRSSSLDVAKYIAKFNARGTDGMVLDLRGNGGGSLKEAVLLTALFTHPGPVVQIRERGQLYVFPTFPDQPTFAYRKPVIVMIDRASASASEIVAAALQDTGRAIIVGDSHSHGKGTVQTVMPMGNDKFGSVKITTARFYRLNGSSTQVKGVESDVCLPSVLEELDTIGEDKLPNALPWNRVERAIYEQFWDLGKYAPQLRELSLERTKKSPKFIKHLRAVELFKKSAERKVVPLERNARLAVMREEREMREYDDENIGREDEEPKDKRKRDDVVLQETFNVLADLVRLTGGAQAPEAPAPRIPAWLRALGNN